MKSNLLYKQLPALLLFAAFLAQTFSRTFVIADYVISTAKYAENCENKTKPVLQCNGKCQMLKKLEQEEQKNEQNPERKAEYKNDITISSKSFFAAPGLQEERLPKPRFAPLQNGKELKMPRFVFHPPAA